MAYKIEEIVSIIDEHVNKENFCEASYCEDLEPFIPLGYGRVCAGCTKCVIVPYHENFVIKIPFYVYYEDDEFWDLTGAGAAGDYCTYELNLYESAAHASLESFFAKTEFYMETSNALPVFTQEKCITFFDSDACKRTKPNIEIISAQSPSYSRGHACFQLNSIWMEDAIKYYGADAVEAFCQFLDDFEITDLHSENYGYRLDGTPCVIDFSSFNEEF